MLRISFFNQSGGEIENVEISTLNENKSFSDLILEHQEAQNAYSRFLTYCMELAVEGTIKVEKGTTMPEKSPNTLDEYKDAVIVQALAILKEKHGVHYVRTNTVEESFSLEKPIKDAVETAINDTFDW